MHILFVRLSVEVSSNEEARCWTENEIPSGSKTDDDKHAAGLARQTLPHSIHIDNDQR